MPGVEPTGVNLTLPSTGTTVGGMNRLLLSLGFLLLVFFVLTAPCPASEIAPRISDREIVERLARLDARLDGLQKRLEEGQTALNKRIDDLRSEMNGRFDTINGRFDSINGRFDSINGRFDTLQWTLGLFITIALVILGFVLRLQWQMSRRQTRMETVLETHREEIAFLKELIEKLLPPRQTL